MTQAMRCLLTCHNRRGVRLAGLGKQARHALCRLLVVVKAVARRLAPLVGLPDRVRNLHKARLQPHDLRALACACQQQLL